MLYKVKGAEERVKGHPIFCQVPSYEKASAAFPMSQDQGCFLRE